ncbi:hypothetical protein CEXT_312871 [Caerostris extrusa]|uniref:Uncharacterized protein n=1 Tax=Caerostris extrusa TaxID=172846 RepID=A0AAV4S7E2_CAEEX|nr:hypothetical protein CEXT_312871 [Caerostris extrusa]
MSLYYRVFLRPRDPPSAIQDVSGCDRCREDRVQEQLSKGEERSSFISAATKEHFEGCRFLPRTKKRASSNEACLSFYRVFHPPDLPSVIRNVPGCDRYREDRGAGAAIGERRGDSSVRMVTIGLGATMDPTLSNVKARCCVVIEHGLRSVDSNKNCPVSSPQQQNLSTSRGILFEQKKRTSSTRHVSLLSCVPPPPTLPQRSRMSRDVTECREDSAGDRSSFIEQRRGDSLAKMQQKKHFERDRFPSSNKKRGHLLRGGMSLSYRVFLRPGPSRNDARVSRDLTAIQFHLRSHKEAPREVSSSKKMEHLRRGMSLSYRVFLRLTRPSRKRSRMSGDVTDVERTGVQEQPSESRKRSSFISEATKKHLERDRFLLRTKKKSISYEACLSLIVRSSTPRPSSKRSRMSRDLTAADRVQPSKSEEVTSENGNNWIGGDKCGFKSHQILEFA